MAKLARVDHNRCDEYSGTTLVWIEDSMTEEQFEEAVDRASEAYLEAATEFMKMEKPGKGAYDQPKWEDNRDRTVGEVLDEHQARKEERAEWDKARRAATRSFESYLNDEKGIHGFWDVEPELKGEVYWGHRHGMAVEYGMTTWPKFRLLKQVRVSKPSGRVMSVSEEDEWA